MLIRPPATSAVEVLRSELLRTPPYAGFQFAVAWARQRGVELIAEALESFPGRTRGIVGLNNRITSYEALYLLLERLGELWVFYKHPLQTFHPKLYLFEPDPAQDGQPGAILIGSSNLTAGGLSPNFEACWLQELAPPSGSGGDPLSESLQYFEDLVASEFCHQVTSPAFLQDLLSGKYLHLEKTLQARARRAVSRQTRGGPGGGLPTAPPGRVERPVKLEVPPPDVEQIEEVVEEEPTVPQVDLPNTLFYVRTLTGNDVAKALREQTGTWEPDLGLEARDEHPEFWGWPDRYVASETGRREWRTQASYHSRALTEGTIQDLCLWYREERPGHPAEHRFRPASRVRDLVIPAAFDTESLMVVLRLGGGGDVDFRVEFLLPGDPGYGDYVSFLSVQKPQHRRGYGVISELADD